MEGWPDCRCFAILLPNLIVIRREWLAYLSQLPHVNLWFRNAAQYRNQTAIINGRKATTDLNLYKLFTEQCTHLVRPGGRCGLVIPSGIYTDLGATQLREMLFTKTSITGLFCFENRKEIFEGVHRSFKFVILSFENGGTTESFPARFMRHDVAELVTFPAAYSLLIDVALVRKLSPDSLSILEFKDEREIVIAKKLSSFSRLGDHELNAWNLALQREFHMTDDAPLYHPKKKRGFVPLVEGKGIYQFICPYSEPRYWLDPKAARAALVSQRLSAIASYCEREGIPNKIKPGDLKIDADSYRFVFRDVARNTDERTMMATVLPPAVFCPHTVSMEVVYRDRLSDGTIELNLSGLTDPERLYLTGLLNSFTVDYQLRQKVTAHLSFFFLQHRRLRTCTCLRASSGWRRRHCFESAACARFRPRSGSPRQDRRHRRSSARRLRGETASKSRCSSWSRGRGFCRAGTSPSGSNRLIERRGEPP